MKKMICLPVLMLFCAICFADITIVQKVDTSPMMGQPAKNLTMTMYVKGSKARIETKEAQAYQILDLQTNKIYNVTPAEKKIMIMSMDLMKHAGDMMGKMGDMKTDLKKTGVTAEVNGPSTAPLPRGCKRPRRPVFCPPSNRSKPQRGRARESN